MDTIIKISDFQFLLITIIFLSFTTLLTFIVKWKWRLKAIKIGDALEEMELGVLSDQKLNTSLDLYDTVDYRDENGLLKHSFFDGIWFFFKKVMFIFIFSLILTIVIFQTNGEKRQKKINYTIELSDQYWQKKEEENKKIIAQYEKELSLGKEKKENKEKPINITNVSPASVYVYDYIDEPAENNNTQKSIFHSDKVDDREPIDVREPRKDGYRLVELQNINLGFWTLPKKTKFQKKGERIKSLSENQKRAILDSPYRLSAIQHVYNIALEHTLDPAESLTVVAQMLQESLLNPLAVSKSNAKGACQFKDGTAREVGVENVWSFDSCVPGLIKYNHKNKSRFKGKLLASNILMAYNAGFSGARKILKKGKGAREARQYAAMIQRWQEFLLENNLVILYDLELSQYASRWKIHRQ